MGLIAVEKSESKTNGTGGHAPSTDIVRTYAPATGELLGELRVTTREEVFDAVARARRAQAAWGILPVSERAARLERFRDAIVERADEVVDVITKECGKPRNEALLHEVFTVADLASYYCKNAARILAPEELDLHFLKYRKAAVHYVPRGVIGIISPWNYPFCIPMGDVFAALVTGSAVVVKPSEVTPLVMLKAKEIYDSTGLPEDLFQVVVGYGATGGALIDAGIQKLVFTGGVETGKKVAAACGERLIPCVMELGGKAPAIVAEDADVERAARAIVFGGFANSGQICISVERVYAHEKVHDKLVSRIKELVSELRQGNPQDGEVDLGAIIFPHQITVAEKHIADAVSKGAEVLTGGKRKAGPGQFFEPTVLVACNHQMTVMTQEIFGPIVPIQKVASEDEAITLANDSHLGLNAYVFTTDERRGKRIAERVQAGSVVVNDVLANYAVAEAPFGGIKQSGYGRVHGDDALRDMAERKHINTERVKLPKKHPFYFPYSNASYRLFRRAMNTLFAGKGIVQRLKLL
jgi:succinate-semialdehyde dehydrogenase/glutarate-semialdehyde dehydrogenase